MRLGEIVKDPDTTRAVAINWTTYMGTDTVSGCAWTAPTGLTIVGTPTLVASVATALVSGGQEGCDYNLTCRATLSSGATEDGTVVVKVRTGDADPRLTR